MSEWDLGALARAAGADTRGGGLLGSVAAVGTDSRSLPPACLFVALRGGRFDGHEFAAAAVAAGARAVLVDARGERALGDIGVPRLVVPDTQRALGDIAAWARRRANKPLVAITGSNGKTTTKELCAAALSPAGEVHKTAGNLNNLIGMPLTLLAWPDPAWVGVIEMGMNAPGEIARLTEIAAPTVGLITNVAAAHLAGLGTVEAVAQAKGELFAGLPRGATVCVNADDPRVVSLAEGLGDRPRLRFGRAPGCDVRVVAHQPTATGSKAQIEVAGVALEIDLPLFGGHNAINAAAALAAGLALGQPVAKMAAALTGVTVPAGRMRVRRDIALPDGRRVNLIDDTYNANPPSMVAAFAAQAELAGGGRRVAVLGDMLELGPSAAALHRQVGAAAAQVGVAWLLSLGELATETARGGRERGAEAVAFVEIERLLADLDTGLRDGDWVLVKGSRGSRMERVASHLETLGAKDGES